MAPAKPFDPKSVLELDGYLEPNVPAIAHRYGVFKGWKDAINQSEGGYDNFTKGYDKFGFQISSGGEVIYREWAPNVIEATLIGDFSQLLFLSFLNIVFFADRILSVQITGIGYLIP